MLADGLAGTGRGFGNRTRRRRMRRNVVTTACGDLRINAAGKGVGMVATGMVSAADGVATQIRSARFATGRDVQPRRRVPEGDDTAEHGGNQRAKKHRSEKLSPIETRTNLLHRDCKT